jgi:WD40 repeat protein
MTSKGSVVVWPDPLISNDRYSVKVFSGEHSPRVLAWSPDGARIAVAADMWLYVFGSHNGDLREVWGGWVTFFGSPAAISWRPDSGAFAVASNDPSSGVGSIVSLWDAAPKDRTYSVLDHRYAGVLDLAWQPSGDYLAVAYTDSTVRLWRPVRLGSDPLAESSATANEEVNPWEHRVHRAVAAVAEGDGAKALVQSLPGSGIIMTSYDSLAAKGEILESINPHPDRRRFIIPTAAVDSVVAVEWDRLIEQVYSSTQACQDWAVPASVAVHTFGFPDLELALLRSPDGKVIKRTTWQMPRCLAVDPTHSCFVAGSETGKIALFNMQTLERICQIRIDEAVQGCAFDPKGQRLAVAGSENVYVFRIRGQGNT